MDFQTDHIESKLPGRYFHKARCYCTLLWTCRQLQKDWFQYFITNVPSTCGISTKPKAAWVFLLTAILQVTIASLKPSFSYSSLISFAFVVFGRLVIQIIVDDANGSSILVGGSTEKQFEIYRTNWHFLISRGWTVQKRNLRFSSKFIQNTVGLFQVSFQGV